MKTFNKETFKEQIWIWETELREGIENDLERVVKHYEGFKGQSSIKTNYIEEMIYSWAHSHLWHNSNIGETYANYDEFDNETESVETEYPIYQANLNLIAHLVMDFFNQRKSANKISMDGRTFKEKLEWFYDKSTERLELNAKEKFEEENSQ